MILVALGANLPSIHGSPVQTLSAARQALRDRGVAVPASSRIWLTAPVPVSDQPWFHNAVIRVETGLEPAALLSVLNEIEHEFGRVRTIRNAPRFLDLDLLAYRDRIMDDPYLMLPHPRMHDRAFVLRPLHDVAPDWVHPRSGRSLPVMIDALPRDEQDARPVPPDEDWL